jgi:hypothetical protein
MRIPFSHTPNYDPASPHSKLQQNSPPRTTTPHITQNEQTPCSLFPTYAYHDIRLTLYSGMHGYLDRKSTAHRMIRSDQSRTWYFPWNSAQRHQRRGDDHHQTMMCVPYAYHVNRLLL